MLKLCIALLLSLTSKCLFSQDEIKSWYQMKFDEDESEGVFLSIHTGVNVDRMKRSGVEVDFLNFENSTQMYLAAVGDFEITNSFIIRVGFAYKPLYFRGKGSPYTDGIMETELKIHSFVPHMELLGRSPAFRRFRIYGGIGIGGLISTIKKNTITVHWNNTTRIYEDGLKLDEQPYAIIYSLGLLYAKRYDLCCKYWRSTWNKLEDELSQSLINKSITLSISYRF